MNVLFSGFGNRVWVNPAQRSGGGNYVQPSSFSSQQGGNNWGPGGGGGGGGRDSQAQSSNFSFAASSPNQNRFSALNTQSSFDQGGRGEGEDNEKHLMPCLQGNHPERYGDLGDFRPVAFLLLLCPQSNHLRVHRALSRGAETGVLQHQAVWRPAGIRE
ncbi:unnamed protein product [Oncorhynchus mykiss]|uniref:Uncharacterized protein n=1 Tax=Oncorhynchus mykiss TaxID=8022 RepID=A0A060ZLU4_ONCMY|nr:unnamed protein product [Oncorhynchus mykiss]